MLLISLSQRGITHAVFNDAYACVQAGKAYQEAAPYMTNVVWTCSPISGKGQVWTSADKKA